MSLRHPQLKLTGTSSLLRKPATYRDATYCLRDYLPFANPRDIKGGIHEYLNSCRKANCMRTVQKRLVRVLSFYNSIGHPIKIPMPSLPAPLPEIYTAEAIQALLEHAGESRLLFLTLLQAGLRAVKLRILGLRTCSTVAFRSLRTMDGRRRTEQSVWSSCRRVDSRAARTFDSFAFQNKALFKSVKDQYDSSNLNNSPKMFFQKLFFDQRNKIVHDGHVDSQRSDGEMCLSMALALLRILSAMHQERIKRMDEAHQKAQSTPSSGV
jgi:integrase